MALLARAHNNNCSNLKFIIIVFLPHFWSMNFLPKFRKWSNVGIRLFTLLLLIWILIWGKFIINQCGSGALFWHRYIYFVLWIPFLGILDFFFSFSSSNLYIFSLHELYIWKFPHISLSLSQSLSPSSEFDASLITWHECTRYKVILFEWLHLIGQVHFYCVLVSYSEYASALVPCQDV